jgi:23S rRNA (pseudouridine1915-N3)-methyltransferase
LHGDGTRLYEQVILRLLFVGKTRETWIKEGVDEYLKRLGPLIRMELVELPDVSISKAGNIPAVIDSEAEIILKHIKPEDHVVVLDERGEMKSSLEFSAFLTNLSDRKSVVFVVGGVYGTADKVKERANSCLSLSRLTYTHQMARLVLTEQIYRALMIQNNRSYHY